MHAQGQVFLWSSLPNAARVSGGKWEVAHFSDKAKVGAETWQENVCPQIASRIPAPLVALDNQLYAVTAGLSALLSGRATHPGARF